ncbi:MAG: T9SS type A sorting domain-containing protein [Flavobacteriales bacterium]|jgi:hypothetical protein
MAYTLYLKNTTINVDENSIGLEFNLYPNPANHSVQIEFGNNLGDETEVALYDVAGALVKIISKGDNYNAGHKINFSVAEFSAGFYFVKVTSKSQQLSKKLLVNH